MAKYNTTVRNSRMQAVIDAVGANGFLKIYAGTVPSGTGISRSGNTLLVNIGITSLGTVSNGVVTQNTVNAVTPSASGVATFADLTNNAGTVVAQLTVSATGGGGEVQLASTSISTAIPVDVTTIQLVEGNA